MSIAAIVGAVLIVLAYAFWNPKPATAPSTTAPLSQADRAVTHGLAAANRLIQQGDPTEAMEVYQRLIQQYPQRPEPYNNLAALYARKGNLDAAKAALEKGLRTSPVYGALYQNLGMIYAQIARNSYGKALQLDTRPTVPQLVLLSPAALPAAAPSTAPAKPAPPPAAEKTPAPAATSAGKTSTPEVAKVPAKPEPAVPAPNPSAPARTAAAAPPPLPAPAVSEDQAIRDAVLAWAEAWSARDYEAYASFYADSYQPKAGRSRQQWESLRRRRLERPQWIKIALSEIRIKHTGTGRAQVTFVQNYASNLFHDASRKALDLVEIGGHWRIAAEHSLGVLK